MKKLTYILLSALAISLTFYSCVEDTEYDTPQISCDFLETDLTGSETQLITILDSWLYQSDEDENDIVDWYETEVPLEFDEVDYKNYITGYVVSDDRTGNFYKELYLQSAPSNPDYSIKLALDVSASFTKYDVGRKVYVYLKGLALNRVRGEMVLGELINNQVDEMRLARADENIFRNCEAVAVTPIELESPSLVDDTHIGKLIAFDNMQFDSSLVDLDVPEDSEPFVDPFDSYDSHRLITSCVDNSQIRLETSTFASFGDDALPNLKGSVKGVLTRDYGDNFYVLRVSSPDDFVFDQDRCDPDYLDCNNPNPIGGSNILFDDDFESYAVNETNLSGWSNINVNGGSELFEIRSFDNEKYVQCSAYNSGETPLEVWLITDAINLDSSTDEELTFKTKTGYNNGAALSVFVSTDYAGDISSATWMLVNAEIADGPSGSYEPNFTDSGSVDISCLDGDVFVAFKYLGGDGGITTTFQIDDVKVTGN